MIVKRDEWRCWVGIEFLGRLQVEMGVEEEKEEGEEGEEGGRKKVSHVRSCESKGKDG